MEERDSGLRGVEGIHVGDAQASVEQGRKRRMRARDKKTKHGSTNPDPLSDGEDTGESVFGVANTEGADGPGVRIPDEARTAALDNRIADGVSVALKPEGQRLALSAPVGKFLGAGASTEFGIP